MMRIKDVMYETELRPTFYLLFISNKQNNLIEIITEKKHKNIFPSFQILEIVYFNNNPNFTKQKENDLFSSKIL